MKNTKGKNKWWKEGTPTVFLKECWKSIGKKPSKGRMVREKCPEPKVVCFQWEWAQAEWLAALFPIEKKDRIKRKSWTSWAKDKLPSTREGESDYQNFSIYNSGYSYGNS